MERAAALLTLESLSSGIRLDIFRLLVRQGPEGLVAGEMATALELAPSNLSFHLKGLAQAGLVSVTQEGRFQRYRANLPLMLELIAYLTADRRVTTPFARGYAVRDVMPFGLKRLTSYLREHRLGVLEIKKRGLDVDPAALRKRLRPSGPHAATLILTPTASGTVAVVARRVG